MLPKLSRGLRLALMLTLSVGYIGYHGHTHAAFAKGDDDDGDSDDPDEKSGEEKDSEEDGGEDDKDQPPVTAGGLFTLKTYPVNEILRPLTLTQGITQVRLALGADLSAKGAFKTFGVNLEGQYGVTDNFMVIGGITDAYNFAQFGVYAGFEASLYYDLLDVRVAANLHRTALPKYDSFCSPVGTADKPGVTDVSQCSIQGSDTAIVSLPTGDYDKGDLKFSIDVGFPFRYAFAPQVALVALQTLIGIDFNRAAKDHNVPTMLPITNADGTSGTIVSFAPAENKVTPDFKPSIGIAFNPIPQLSVVAMAQLIIPDFDTSAGAFQVPVTGRVEFSPSQQLDIGLEFTLLNVKPPDPISPVDSRYLSLYAQARF